MLRHGVFEMHFIHEIRFLKAYYWANLGKFAFTPEDRLEWTGRAIKDFNMLGVPVDIYCNPDPANLHYRGFPADLRYSNIASPEEKKDNSNRNSSIAQTSNSPKVHVQADLA